jgi:hypothetical protein
VRFPELKLESIATRPSSCKQETPSPPIFKV